MGEKMEKDQGARTRRGNGTSLPLICRLSEAHAGKRTCCERCSGFYPPPWPISCAERMYCTVLKLVLSRILSRSSWTVAELKDKAVLSTSRIA